MSVDGLDITWTESDTGYVILDLAGSQYYSINDSAASIWPLITEGSDEEALATSLADKWEIPVETARADVAALLNHLAERGLVRLGSGSAADAG
ncbi:PqqD family protein [uncultured Williamsia sp.]|uniref:PqqD family protein n=1 Tax=uncultured Williamsia sp. TaxID=259311 RepID=UPI00261FB579|nr:PqqD family protein [uncultured Williamsia sp.]